jgi:hypothetical protein
MKITAPFMMDFEKHADDEGPLCIYILRVKIPNVYALKLCE